MVCSLCAHKDLVQQLHQDTVCWAAHTINSDNIIVVLNRHDMNLSTDEWLHLRTVGKMLKPNSWFSKTRNLMDHYHIYEIKE